MALKVGPSRVVIEERASHWDESPTRMEYFRLAGRDTLDFTVSDGASMLQLMDYVRATFGTWLGFRIADDLDFNFADGRRVTIREATAEELDRHEFRQMPKLTIPFQIQVPAAVLQGAEQDAIIILRIGAIANALQTALRGGRSSATSPLVNKRDDIQRGLVVASYLHEARHVIYHDNSHKGRLWELATAGIQSRQGLLPFGIVEECHRLLDDGGPLATFLRQLRNFFGFHSLPNEFRLWLRRQSPDERIMLECAPDPRTSDVVFVASVQTIGEAYSDEAAAEFLRLAETLARALPYLIEAAIWGLVTKQGIDHSKCLAFSVDGLLRKEDEAAARSDS